MEGRIESSGCILFFVAMAQDVCFIDQKGVADRSLATEEEVNSKLTKK